MSRPTPESQIPVRLEPYSPHWAERFKGERGLLLEALGDKARDIQHFGSTSVPGLSAKPTVDIMVGIVSFPWQHDSLLERLDYRFYKAPNPKWRVYLKPYGRDVRGYHLHIVPVYSDHWRTHLLFRDYLRTHPEAATSYAVEKARLAKEYSGRRGSYQVGKKKIVEALMARAEAWQGKP